MLDYLMVAFITVNSGRPISESHTIQHYTNTVEECIKVGNNISKKISRKEINTWTTYTSPIDVSYKCINLKE